MKKILLLITVMLMSCQSAFAALVPWNPLCYNADPSLVQRGVLMKNWQTLDQYAELDSVKYQVVKDTVKNEVFAIVNQADPALKGVVNVPQFITADGYGRLEVRGLGLFSFYLTKVSKVILPESLEYIGDCSFYRCYELTKFNIPEKVHSIGDLAFAYTAIDTLRISDNVIDMGALFFDSRVDAENEFRCLKYLYIGKNVKNICGDIWIFGRPSEGTYWGLNSYLSGLDKIDVSPNNEVLYSDNGLLYSKETHALAFYPPQKRELIFRMPDDIPNIGIEGFVPFYINNPDNRDVFHIRNDWVQILIMNEQQDSVRWAESKFSDLREVILPYNMKKLCGLPCMKRNDKPASIYVQNPVPCAFQYYSNFDYYYPLYVPKGSLEAYKSDSEWGKFKLILEYDTIDYSVDYTSAIEPKVEEAKVVVEGNNVSITTADNQSVAYIYDICGRLVASGCERTFSINQKGVFVLRFNSLTKKFIIR